MNMKTYWLRPVDGGVELFIRLDTGRSFGVFKTEQMALVFLSAFCEQR